ncbi:hypothetical protein AB0L99_42485 [Streptomyces sp. NPDC051954]|uniref:hypothetical protein n=1 Tax=Streptomyces sp. NPDC051954 TaxID=3155524 RepID=UPI00342BCFC2
MSTSTLPRVPNGHRYCWAEHPRTHVHCTEPAGHRQRDGNGGHWHPYSKTSW